MSALKFAVIGHPVAHSLSPVMHAANFRSVGLDAEYDKFDVPPGELEGFVRARQREGYTGLNVTVPHKIAVMSLLDRPDESVVRYGACNTLKFERDGSISGWNTDVIGFVSTLAAHGFKLKGRKVFILGRGGAGSALARCAEYEGAAAVSVYGRNPDSVEVRDAKAREADLVVNATPVGLNPGDVCPLPVECFHPGQLVLDIIPTKEFPPMAAAARAAGATAVDGLEFLVGQGAKSFEIWTGMSADRAAMLAALR